MPRPKKPVSSTRVTRPCTKVYYSNIPPDEEVSFEVRPYDTVTEYASRPFKSDPHVDLDDIEDMLKAKQEELELIKRTNTPILQPLRRAIKLTWKSRVDNKRSQVADMLRHQVKINLAEVRRALKCSYSLVKRVHQELLMQGEHSDFQPQNLKEPQDIQQLVESVSQVQGTYTTIGDLKRLHTTFSHKWIARQMHAQGLRYHKMARRRRVEKRELYRKQEVINVVKHLAQAHANSRTVETYFIDEVHFPLEQTADKHWTRPDQGDQQLVYNRRQACTKKISAIALCDFTGFRAVQFFIQEVTAPDFLFFLQEALTRLPQVDQVTILADNASWHNAKSIRKTKAVKFLHFNAPKLYQSNAIENCFSYVRSAFRKRPLVHSVEEEVRLLAGIFFDEKNKRRTAGVARNHIRCLLELLYYNYMGLQVDDSGNSLLT
jgi:hypothetical protein